MALNQALHLTAAAGSFLELLDPCATAAGELGSLSGGGTVRADYTVLFSNFTRCAIGISDINWSVKVVADSEASAIELALEQARVLNREKGMPPHGTYLADDGLRNLAIAIVYGDPVPRGDAATG